MFSFFSQELKISLSPPPDLVVSSVTTVKSYYTGDTIKVQFIVSNDGLGEPFHYWWRDRVVSKHYNDSVNWSKLLKTKKPFNLVFR